MEIVEGSIFDSECECLVNPTNSVGVMGAGLALQFLRRFPLACGQFNHDSRLLQGADECWKRDHGSHNLQLLPPRLYVEFHRNLLMFPTKIHWKYPSKLEYIEENLPKAFTTLEDNNIKSVAFPMLGCGLGGLSKSDVLTRIKKHAEMFDGHVEVYT